eukprot:CAMPEP_0116578112 /NCGR_PEP_ID=MMETSP0397-20121206/21517_1 /TAXON_ID=216820 /ORGANISM="Cyclophora tenuis, Strain ECT3854" /LENGTH=136 /DNA_ID=CAMNT_0004107449 /DNA_START=73 /DNA_END=483 /DNA_ORIENTATION=-
MIKVTRLPAQANKPVLSIFAEMFPKAAHVTNREGRLALHLAIDCGKTFSTGILSLICAAPESLETMDPKTELYPFQQAATPDCKAPLTTVFELLRAKPELIDPSRPIRRKDAQQLKRKRRRSDSLDDFHGFGINEC